MTNEEAIKVLRTESIELGGSAPSVCRFLEALDMAVKALEDVPDKVVWKNDPLTLDELSERNAPVFLPIKDFPNGGYWCLCENGYIIPPSGRGFMAKERPNWVFYSQKPEDGHDERKENENA